MRRLALISSLLTGLVVSGFVALAAAPGVIQQYVATCSSDFPTRCILPNADGSINVNGGSAGTPLDVNVTEIAGTAAATGVGASNAGTLRVMPANEALTPLGTAGSPATSIVTTQGIASMTPLLTNPGTAASWGVGATGSAPPANATYNGANGSGATGGLLAGIKICDLHVKYDASDTGSITLVTGISGRKVYVCGYILATGGTSTNLKLREGSDANCATNAADLTPAYQLVANDKVGFMSAIWGGLAVSTNAYYVCVNASAANSHQAEIWYTIQ